MASPLANKGAVARCVRVGLFDCFSTCAAHALALALYATAAPTFAQDPFSGTNPAARPNFPAGAGPSSGPSTGPARFGSWPAWFRGSQPAGPTSVPPPTLSPTDEPRRLEQGRLEQGLPPNLSTPPDPNREYTPLSGLPLGAGSNATDPPATQASEAFPGKTSTFTLPGQVGWQTLGRSVEDRVVEYATFGRGPRTILLLGPLSGRIANVRLVEQAAGYFQQLEQGLNDVTVVVIRNPNPDATAQAKSVNAHGVDLNRNFPSQNWQLVPGVRSYVSGKAAASEPETRLVLAALSKYQPSRVVHVEGTATVPTLAWSGLSPHAAQSFGRAAQLTVDFKAAHWKTGSLAAFCGADQRVPTLQLALPTEGWNGTGWGQVTAPPPAPLTTALTRDAGPATSATPLWDRHGTLVLRTMQLEALPAARHVPAPQMGPAATLRGEDFASQSSPPASPAGILSFPKQIHESANPPENSPNTLTFGNRPSFLPPGASRPAREPALLPAGEAEPLVTNDGRLAKDGWAPVRGAESVTELSSSSWKAVRRATSPASPVFAPAPALEFASPERTFVDAQTIAVPQTTVPQTAALNAASDPLSALLTVRNAGHPVLEPVTEPVTEPASSRSAERLERLPPAHEIRARQPLDPAGLPAPGSQPHPVPYLYPRTGR